MRLKQKIKYLANRIIKMPIWVLILITVLSALLIVSLMYFQDRIIKYSYSVKTTCIQQLTFLPNIVKDMNNKSNILVENSNFIKIGNIQLFSTKTCFKPGNALSVGSVNLTVSLFGGWFAQKTYIFNISNPPTIDQNSLNHPVPTSKSLELKLSDTDLVFDYQLEADNKIIACIVSKTSIYCDVKSLKLLQGVDYQFKIIRVYNDQKIATVLNKKIRTLNATSVTDASVAANQIIYDNPRTITVNFDKDIIKANIILEQLEDDKHIGVEMTAVFDNKRAIINIGNDLKRDSSYVISIDGLEAKDGSTLVEPYKIDFRVSGGPSVTSINIGAISAPLSKTIVLTFDQVLSDTQNVANFVNIIGADARISIADNQVFISYSNAPLCANLDIKVNPGLLSNYGVIQNDLWSFSTRTICYSVINIGHSVEGRSIPAFIFGNGSQKTLFTGSIHGDELSSKYLMDAWINELELNARSIPIDKKIIVIPTLNPDGVASNKRNNSNNVDINRNFPMSDWQTNIFTPANQLIYGGGGAFPLSEPESQSIANFTLQLRPRLTLSYHSNASYVIGDPWGDSATLAATYSHLSGYRNMTGLDGAFSYHITGTYDGWLLEKYGLMSIIIELSSSNSSEFGRNKAALWAMARY